MILAFHLYIPGPRHGVRGSSLLVVISIATLAVTLAAVTGVAPAIAGAAPAAERRVDCKSTPTSSPDAAVCGSPLLGRLDRELKRLYDLATSPGAGASARTISAGQRAWLAEREKCMRGPDIATCMRDVYLQRIAAIRAESSSARGGGRGASLGPFEFECPGTPVSTIHITYANARPSFALITVDGKYYVLSQARSASGARYEGRGALFWEHQDEARWRAAADGIESTCKRVSPQ